MNEFKVPTFGEHLNEKKSKKRYLLITGFHSMELEEMQKHFKHIESIGFHECGTHEPTRELYILTETNSLKQISKAQRSCSMNIGQYGYDDNLELFTTYDSEEDKFIRVDWDGGMKLGFGLKIHSTPYTCVPQESTVKKLLKKIKKI